MAKKRPDNRTKTGQFAPGHSGNPGGRPKRGESWSNVFQYIGDLTPVEAADMCAHLATSYRSLGDKITLKEAVVLRIFLALISEPEGEMLDRTMNRSDGPVAQTVNVNWRQQLEEIGAGDLFEQLVQSLTASLDRANGGGSDTGSEPKAEGQPGG